MSSPTDTAPGIPSRPSLLYLSDQRYQASGRRYGEEDSFLAEQLRPAFAPALAHPKDAVDLMDRFDLLLIRNIGPVLHFQADFDRFLATARARGTRVFNTLTGKADMMGKQYLLDLTALGYPVIPTVDRSTELNLLPDAEQYVSKPKRGADSIGLQIHPREGLAGISFDDTLVQPLIPFRYEVSFYFIGRAFHYALYAPDPGRRWLLEPYRPTPADLAFAQLFVDWNTIELGIQRVDACRTPAGELLLVEVEDLNPYLSLSALDDATRTRFVTEMITAMQSLL